MTNLNKKVARVTSTSVRNGSKARVLVASLEPGDVIGLRLKGCRKTYYLAIDSAFYYAAKLEGERLRREKKARKAK